MGELRGECCKVCRIENELGSLMLLFGRQEGHEAEQRPEEQVGIGRTWRIDLGMRWAKGP